MGEPEEQFMATSRDAHFQDVNVQQFTPTTTDAHHPDVNVQVG
jgi:hypothetical protein